MDLPPSPSDAAGVASRAPNHRAGSPTFRPAPAAANAPLLRVLRGEAVWPPPVWLMRQAGRHLPEYRELRARAGSFLDLCYAPEFAAEVTLQPVRRYGLDAAILFSDILVLPDALGQAVSFAAGEGPRLDPPVTDRAGLAGLREEADLSRLAPVFETVRRVRTALPPEVALIGFCGAPFTVLAYMAAGRGGHAGEAARALAANDPATFEALLDRLVEGSVRYLTAQVEAGADALQIFESFAGACPPEHFRAWCLSPTRRIIEGVRAACGPVPFIVFPRGACARAAETAAETGANAVGIDWETDLAAAVRTLPPHVASQGNVSPDTLVEGGEALDRAIDTMLAAARGRPHVANLGHGVLPPTPIPHVERFVARVRGG